MDYKQKRYTDYPSPRAYLEHIMKNWHAYKQHNTGICQAIQDLLDENEMLQYELDQLRKR